MHQRKHPPENCNPNHLPPSLLHAYTHYKHQHHENTPSRIHAATEEIRKQGVARAGAKPNTECGKSRSKAEDSSRREQKRSRKQGAARAGSKPKTGRGESRGRNGAARADERLHGLIYGKNLAHFFVAKPKNLPVSRHGVACSTEN